LQNLNYQQPLKVSIVTAVYNRARTLEHALNSVGQQTYPTIEHVLVDGGSSDGTMDLIRKATLCSPVIVSERDDGIYDALNKGLRLATGGDYEVETLPETPLVRSLGGRALTLPFRPGYSTTSLVQRLQR
jgi:hypothetical protein